MNYEKALDFLYTRELFGIKLGLSNVRALLEKLNNPHKNLKFIHVAGTNGKGSCCAMISSILQAQGYKVGLYTSPHLIDFRERIQINNKKITKKELLTLVKKIKPLVKKQTYFEVITSLAIEYFKQKKVDFVILEVGLGGRLDATNIVTPLLSVITNISLEHKEYLGDTIEKIAYEKAGIVKKNIPTLTAANGKALKVIKDICKKRNSKLSVVKTNNNIKTNLEGSFQLTNASTSIKTINLLQEQEIKISQSSISKGLKHVLWPGRFQFIKNNILLDCAHNPAATKTLAKEVNKLKYRKLILMIGIMEDKDIKKMVKEISPLADDIIITKPKILRSANPERISKHIKNNYAIIPDIKNAIKFATSITKKNDLLLITGSIYTVGEAMQYLFPFSYPSN